MSFPYCITDCLYINEYIDHAYEQIVQVVIHYCKLLLIDVKKKKSIICIYMNKNTVIYFIIRGILLFQLNILLSSLQICNCLQILKNFGKNLNIKKVL